jgi:hypothetical protein
MDEQLALKIAQDFFNANEVSDRREFPIVSNGVPTGDIIVITVAKISSAATKSVAGPKGITCPTCNGTGKIG